MQIHSHVNVSNENCESPKSRSRWRHACYCLEQSDLVSPGIQIEDSQSVSPRWGSAAGMRRCCQQTGTGIKGDGSGCREWVEIGNPHGSVRCCKCHTSTTEGCHYVMRVTRYETYNTRKGGPLGRAWHLPLGAAFWGETSPVGISCMWNLYIYVCIGTVLNKW